MNGSHCSKLARIFEKPAVLTGQTLGPRLRPEERRLLTDTLRSARFVGVRELPSAALAEALGVAADRIWYQGDDALFLDTQGSSVEASRTPSIAVTIDPQLRAAGRHIFDAFVRGLREIAGTAGARLVLIPHAFGGEQQGLPSDAEEARVLAGRLQVADCTIAENLSAREAKRITGEAAMVISTRYHPLVFGLAAAVPSIGLYGDEYCRIKLQGALAHAQLERCTLTFDEVARRELVPLALALWRTRDDLRRDIESHHARWRREAAGRWAAVLRALDSPSMEHAADTSLLFGRPLEEVAPGLVSALEARRRAWEADQETGLRRIVKRSALAFGSRIFARIGRILQPGAGLRRQKR